MGFRSELDEDTKKIINQEAFDPSWEKDDYQIVYYKFKNHMYKALMDAWQGSINDDLFIQLHTNAFVFSKLKHMDFLGGIKEVGAKESFEKHKTSLVTEANTFSNATKVAQEWKKLMSNKDKEPYLMYVANNDARPTHNALDGVIALKTDGFWNTHLPPLGFNCKCHVRSITKEQKNKLEAKAKKEDKNIDPQKVDMGLTDEDKEEYKQFKHHVAKTGKVFGEEHPYFKKHFEAFGLKYSNNIKDAISNLKEVQLTIQEKLWVGQWSGNGYRDYHDYYHALLNNYLNMYDEASKREKKVYVKNLERTIRKFPKYQGISYRGEKYKSSDNKHLQYLISLRSGDPFLFWQHRSSSASLDIVGREYLDEKFINVTFEIYNKNSYLISELSKYTEKEILTEKEGHYIVLDVVKKKIIIKKEIYGGYKEKQVETYYIKLIES